MSLGRVAANRLLWVVASLVVLTLVYAGSELATQALFQHQQQLRTLTEIERSLGGIAAHEASQASARVRELRGAPARVVQTRLDEIDRNQAQFNGRTPLSSMPTHQVALLSLRGALVEEIRIEMRLELWRQEQAYLLRLLQVADFRSAAEQLASLVEQRDAAFRDREAKRLRHQQAQAEVSATERAVSIFRTVPDVETEKASRKEYDAAVRRHRELYERVERMQPAVAVHPGSRDPGSYSPSVGGVENSMRTVISSASAIAQENLQANWVHRILESWAPSLIKAVKAVGLCVLAYVIWKFVFFYVVAPWVTRRPPIRLERGASTPHSPVASRGSAVSLRVELSAGQEVFVKNAYLQDSPTTAVASTRWLLNWDYPVASLGSGMCWLTRLSAAPGMSVTLSSATDPLDELAEIELSPTSGFVLLPRYLVGIVQDASRPVEIRSAWRAGSLQAWLTFQLRFLVFYGHGKVIVRGCRGVRIDRPDAHRRIAQAATIGFSESLGYSVGQTETFAPYFLGIKPLFTDSFRGEGVYAYQEVPVSVRRSSGIEGKVMGAFDALLKPFGI